MRFHFKKKTTLTLACNQTFRRPVSFILGMIKLYILISGWITLTFIHGHSFIRNENFGIHFLANLSIDLDKIHYVATTCWFVEAQTKFVLHKLYSRMRTLLT